jgi:hypothetical protein
LWRFLLVLEFKQITEPNFNVLMVAGRDSRNSQWKESQSLNAREGRDGAAATAGLTNGRAIVRLRNTQKAAPPLFLRLPVLFLSYPAFLRS